ncbi:MAG: hypothetical protein JNL67_16075 [Planctomycetaceae bacterium]|nr:hypothetical protein [Planctomycetaceae bacterium]
MNDPLTSNNSLIGGENTSTSTEFDFKWVPDLASRLGQWLAQCIVLVMLVVAVYYAFQVFFQVGSLLRDPTNAEAAVRSVAQLIEADKLRISHLGESIEFGRLISVFVLGFGYVFWALIPLWIIGTAARVLKTLRTGPEAPSSSNS